jgi:hypothetical protein
LNRIEYNLKLDTDFVRISTLFLCPLDIFGQKYSFYLFESILLGTHVIFKKCRRLKSVLLFNGWNMNDSATLLRPDTNQGPYVFGAQFNNMVLIG